MPHEWNSFVWAADEWVVNCSLPSGNLILVSVQLFSVGHALELYLKACYTKLTGDIDSAIRFGHNVSEIWFECKARDNNFLPRHELRRSILDCEFLNMTDAERLPREDLLHFIENQEFYVTCKYLADLKYIGAPLKKIKGAYALGSVSHNPKWAVLFHDLRSYLGYPREDRTDIIRHNIDTGDLPPVSVQFLKRVLYG
jgi:hypothetical protein